MVTLPKKTVQKLAVLYTLTLWQRGAYGPLRVHKTLFYADKGKPNHLFTFKKYHHGQYSDDVAEVLNSLQSGGRLAVHFDGPSARLEPRVPVEAKRQIEQLLSLSLPVWFDGLKKAFKELGYLANDDIKDKAHDDESYKESDHNETIFESSLDEAVEISGLGEDWAERVYDLVDEKLAEAILERFEKARTTPQHSSNWRKLFDEEPEEIEF